RWSKKRCLPNSIASYFPDARLLGSFGTRIGHGPCDRMAWISESEKTTLPGFPSACPLHGASERAAPAAAHAIRFAMLLVLLMPLDEVMTPASIPPAPFPCICKTILGRCSAEGNQ